MTRLLVALYLASLALLPWCTFPPFPWLHRHAQWSDAVFAAAAALWLVELWRRRGARAFQWRAFHLLIALYLGAALASLLVAAPDKRAGALKLLGMTELGALAVITSDLAARKALPPLIARVVAVTSLLVAGAALAGLLLFYGGVETSLIGVYGDLTPSPWYARVQALTYNPNLLASFCIFAAAVIGREDAALPRRLRRLTQAALALTVLLTFSRGILGFILAAAIARAQTPRARAFAAALGTACVVAIIGLSVWKLTIDPTRPLAARIELGEPGTRGVTTSTAWESFKAHPWFGTGTGTSPGRLYSRPFDAHLTPLNIASTMGLPALLAFAGLILTLWRERARPTDRATWGGMAGFGVEALAHDIEDFRHLWVLIGLADAGRTKGRDDDEGRETGSSAADLRADHRSARR
jgi:hypothetical protein